MSKNNFYIVIPARAGSTRLPNKPLLEIGDKPMIWHVYQQALKCNAKKVIIATDCKNIKNICEDFGAEVCMTLESHKSGTDRLEEVVSKYNFSDDDIIVNIQGDEPFIPVENILQVAKMLEQKSNASIATLAEKITKKYDVFNSNCVKVVRNYKNEALYFSRAAIPWNRGDFESDNYKTNSCYRHIGLYAYKVSFLHKFIKLPSANIEDFECLEQLRALYFGFIIIVENAEIKSVNGIDTPKDLIKARIYYKNLI